MENFTSHSTSTEVFILRLKNKDPQAQHSVVKEYTPQLYRCALAQGFARETAEDVVHETMVTFFEVFEKFEGRSKVRTFLFGIFYNKVREHRRKIKKHQNNSLYDEETTPLCETAVQSRSYDVEELSPEKKEVLTVIQSGLDRLPEMQRNVFYLKVIEGQDSEQICQDLQIGHANMRQLLSRARQSLRKYISKRIDQ